MVLMEVDKRWKLKPSQVGKDIVFMAFNKFFDCLSYMEEDAVWWSFIMKNFVHKGIERLHI